MGVPLQVSKGMEGKSQPGNCEIRVHILRLPRLSCRSPSLGIRENGGEIPTMSCEISVHILRLPRLSCRSSSLGIRGNGGEIPTRKLLDKWRIQKNQDRGDFLGYPDMTLIIGIPE